MSGSAVEAEAVAVAVEKKLICDIEITCCYNPANPDWKGEFFKNRHAHCIHLAEAHGYDPDRLMQSKDFFWKRFKAIPEVAARCIASGGVEQFTVGGPAVAKWKNAEYCTGCMKDNNLRVAFFPCVKAWHAESMRKRNSGKLHSVHCWKPLSALKQLPPEFRVRCWQVVVVVLIT